MHGLKAAADGLSLEERLNLPSQKFYPFFGLNEPNNVYFSLPPELQQPRRFAFQNRVQEGQEGQRTFTVCFNSLRDEDVDSEALSETENSSRHELAERVEKLTTENKFLIWEHSRDMETLRFAEIGRAHV